MTIALLLVDHGSRVEAANAMLDDVAALVRQQAPGLVVHVAHMELAAPSIADGFGACVAEGADEIIVCPYFLSAGRHATEDVPRLAADAAKAHGVRHRTVEPLGLHPLLARLVLHRAGLEPPKPGAS